jgi:hypothetical protein
LRKPSRPGLVGDKPQSGEPGDTTSPLLFFFFFFFVGEPVCCSLASACWPQLTMEPFIPPSLPCKEL